MHLAEHDSGAAHWGNGVVARTTLAATREPDICHKIQPLPACTGSMGKISEHRLPRLPNRPLCELVFRRGDLSYY